MNPHTTSVFPPKVGATYAFHYAYRYVEQYRWRGTVCQSHDNDMIEIGQESEWELLECGKTVYEKIFEER